MSPETPDKPETRLVEDYGFLYGGVLCSRCNNVLWSDNSHMLWCKNERCPNFGIVFEPVLIRLTRATVEDEPNNH